MTKDLFGRTLPPPHPGEILRDDILPSLAMTRAELARHLGLPSRVLADLLAERCDVSVDIAVRLGLALGHGARYWLGLQAHHDFWRADTAAAPRVRPILWSRKRADGERHARA